MLYTGWGVRFKYGVLLYTGWNVSIRDGVLYTGWVVLNGMGC